MELCVATTPETLQRADNGVDRSRVAVVIPTCNAAEFWVALRDGLRLQGLPAGQILILDSSSDDGTRELARAEGYQVFRIDRCDFNHGGTRKFALELLPWASVVVYLTQDAILASADSLNRLLSAFEDRDVAAAYGRQLPRLTAGPIEAHARLFNYPPRSEVRDFESRHTLGIKAAFSSNSFAAYRVSELLEVGGFPSDAIVSEDLLVTAKLLQKGRKAAYVAEAQVYHSHAFTVAEEFRRYFDIGVCHRRESWLQEPFGKPAGEGGRFVVSELSYLSRRNPLLIPIALLRNISKGLGYQLGVHGTRLGTKWSRRLSYQRSFWDGPAITSGIPFGANSGPQIPPSRAASQR
jgi:rhamnosyltransferase